MANKIIFTQSELCIMRALQTAPCHAEEVNGLRLITKLTRSGVWRVIRRMERRGLVEVGGINRDMLRLTFSGIKAVYSEQVSA